MVRMQRNPSPQTIDRLRQLPQSQTRGPPLHPLRGGSRIDRDRLSIGRVCPARTVGENLARPPNGIVISGFVPVRFNVHFLNLTLSELASNCTFAASVLANAEPFALL